MATTEEQKQQTISFLLASIPKGAPQVFTTEQLGAYLGVTQGTIRGALCQKGHYLGLVPEKLPNRKLRWHLR